MRISLIVALDKNFVIGNKGHIPWHLPADLEHFRKITMGKPIIMGRTTFESIGKVLPGRLNVVLTHDTSYQLTGVLVAHSVEDALKIAGTVSEAMVIGGAKVYRQFMSLAYRMYLTLIDGELEGDAYFPKFDWNNWREVESETHKADRKNLYPYTFVTLERK